MSPPMFTFVSKDRSDICPDSNNLGGSGHLQPCSKFALAGRLPEVIPSRQSQFCCALWVLLFDARGRRAASQRQPAHTLDPAHTYWRMSDHIPAIEPPEFFYGEL